VALISLAVDSVENVSEKKNLTGVCLLDVEEDEVSAILVLSGWVVRYSSID
jgi:hypothetical protein